MALRFGAFHAAAVLALVSRTALGIELLRRETGMPAPAEPIGSGQPAPESVAQPKEQAAADSTSDLPGSPPMKLIIKCCASTPRQATALQKQADGKWTVSCKSSAEAGETQPNVDATCSKVLQQVADKASLAVDVTTFNDETDQAPKAAAPDAAPASADAAPAAADAAPAASDAAPAAADAAPAASDAAPAEAPEPPPPQVLKQCCSKSPKEVPVATKSPSGSFEYGCMGISGNVLKQGEIDKICGDNADNADPAANSSADPAANSSEKPKKKIPRKILDHHTMNMNPPTGGAETVLSPPEMTEKCCIQTPKKMPVSSKTEDGQLNFTCKGTKDGVSQKEIIQACLAFETSAWRKTNLPGPSLELVKGCCGRKEKERPVEHYWPGGAITFSCEGVSAGWSMSNIEEVCANMTKCAERYPMRDTPDGALSKLGNQGRFPPPKPPMVLECCSKVPRECPVPKLEPTGSYSYTCSGKNSNMTEAAILETCEYLAIDSQVFQPPAPHPCDTKNCTSMDVVVPPAAIVSKCCKNGEFPIGVQTWDGSLTFTCVGESTGLSRTQIDEGCKKYSLPKKVPKAKPADDDK